MSIQKLFSYLIISLLLTLIIQAVQLKMQVSKLKEVLKQMSFYNGMKQMIIGKLLRVEQLEESSQQVMKAQGMDLTPTYLTVKKDRIT